jgi:hypothetical protein
LRVSVGVCSETSFQDTGATLFSVSAWIVIGSGVFGSGEVSCTPLQLTRKSVERRNRVDVIFMMK